MIVDGGKGQLSAVCETLENAGIHDVPVVAISIMSFYAFQLYETLTHPRSRTLPFHTHARSVVLSLLLMIHTPRV